MTRDVPPNSVVYGNPAKIKYSKDAYDMKKREWEAAREAEASL